MKTNANANVNVNARVSVSVNAIEMSHRASLLTMQHMSCYPICSGSATVGLSTSCLARETPELFSMGICPFLNVVHLGTCAAPNIESTV